MSWLGVFIIGILVIISFVFCIMTSMAIATAIGGIGVKWWVYAITVFGTLGGTTGGTLINIGNKN